MRKYIDLLHDERGFVLSTAVIVGATVAAAGAIAGASIASSGAKRAAKTQAEAQQQQIAAQTAAAEADRQERQTSIAKEEAVRQEAVAKKQAAIENINYPTYLSSPEAQKYKGTLEERMAGRGLIDINAQTAPVAEQVRAGFKQTEANIGAAASARGLGRSSIATAQIGEKSQAAERDIAERVAQLELTRQDQIGTAVTQFGTLTEQEAASQQNQAIFKRGGEFNVADTITGKAGAIGGAERLSSQATKEDQFAIARSIEAKGVAQAAAELKQAEIWGSAVIGATKSAAQSSEDVIDALKAEKANRAMVNTGRTAGRTTNSFNSQGIGF